MTSIPLSDLESSPSAKFASIGDTHAGTITNIQQRQQTSIDGKPLVFDDGTPRMQWVITLAKNDGDTVAIYAKGGKFKAASGTGESMLSAIGTAVRAAGATAVDVGGQLAIAYTGESEAQPGRSPAKLYTAQYRPPAPAAPAGIPATDLFDE